ncbi:hypothetical protein AB0O01_06210 [Streptomyces sp. NPDC093252]|uniref:hypothetical protein n=1 Tax=Streptomyces sp. NPDC093252 TaxID=3154980 RepID=UPI00341ED2CE
MTTVPGMAVVERARWSSRAAAAAPGVDPAGARPLDEAAMVHAGHGTALRGRRHP